MSSIAFDTHKFVKRLQSSGLTPEQAEALVDALKDAVTDSQVATKHDLAELKYDLLKWIVGLALAQFGVLIGILLRLA
ncbi:hypothetical protein Talka_01424 [Tepidimonas alkaliphilus]|uniref:DUF1640 domain-containing protein n=1 Tax=Tepidimonas alkaliphilus TaxID=2588942 RepID=A0A554W804_9BURK|nr:coiled-coil domain-containing protein [Tepidimonas alkaliphilus]TSE19705.1 hypothetical protein Talka_01424 [Tepidimonas alkaliphilus]